MRLIRRSPVGNTGLFNFVRFEGLVRADGFSRCQLASEREFALAREACGRSSVERYPGSHVLQDDQAHIECKLIFGA